MFPLDLISQDPVFEFSNAYRHLVHVFSYLEPVSDSLVPVFLYLYSATATGRGHIGMLVDLLFVNDKKIVFGCF